MAHTPNLLVDPGRKDVLEEIRDLFRTEAGETNLTAMKDNAIEKGILNWGQIFGIDGVMNLNYDEGIRLWIEDAPLHSRTVGLTGHTGLWVFSLQVYQLGHVVEDLFDYVTETAQECERVIYKNRRLPTSKAHILHQTGFKYPNPKPHDGRIGLVVYVGYRIRKPSVIS